MKEDLKKNLIFSSFGAAIGFTVSRFILNQKTKQNILYSIIGLGVGTLCGYIAIKYNQKTDFSQEKKINRIIKFERA
jgi:uncharacterized membrane-anchored protein YhcB (DUF1043 family)